MLEFHPMFFLYRIQESCIVFFLLKPTTPSPIFRSEPGLQGSDSFRLVPTRRTQGATCRRCFKPWRGTRGSASRSKRRSSLVSTADTWRAPKSEPRPPSFNAPKGSRKRGFGKRRKRRRRRREAGVLECSGSGISSPI